MGKITVRKGHEFKKPDLPEDKLEELLAGFDEVHAPIANSGGSWGDVADAVNGKFDTELNVESILWLHGESEL
ncbi:MAG: hypothetical protein ABH851_09855 [Methanobacteriota archaeon]